MKKIILLFVAFIFANPTFAQSEQKFSSDDLNGLKIEFASNEDRVYNKETKEYKTVQLTALYFWDDKNQYAKIYVDNVEVPSGTHPYYLSDTEEEFFDYSKVGKPSSGKYIIVAMYDEKTGSKRVSNPIMKIVKISEDEMVISNSGGVRECKILEQKKK